MDDLNLNITGSESSNPDNAPSAPAGTAEMPARPRLRKIKRPKYHGGPIGSGSGFSGAARNPASGTAGSKNTSGMAETPLAQTDVNAVFGYEAGNAGRQTPQGYANPAEYGSAAAADQQQAFSGGLIRAGDRPGFNPDYNNYPSGYVDDYAGSLPEDDFVYQGTDNNFTGSLDLKKVIWMAIGCVLVGLLLGKFIFSSEQIVRNGLQGVVVNPEVPKGRSRCGIAEKTQGCVLYVMNPQRQELNGRDFYDLAAQLTGRQRFVIETGNMRYSSVKIKPGNIAQLNIPPLQ